MGQFTQNNLNPFETPWGITYGNTFNLTSGYVHAAYESDPNNPGFFQLFVAKNPVSSGSYIEDPLSQNVILSSGTVTRIDADGNQFWDSETQTAFPYPNYTPIQGVAASGANYPVMPFKYQVQNATGPASSTM